MSSDSETQSTDTIVARSAAMSGHGRRWVAWPLALILLVGCASPPAPGSPAEAPVAAPVAPVASWSRVPDGPLSARYGPAGAWLDQQFVLVGGYSSRPCPPNALCTWSQGPARRDGARFDPATGTWTSIAEAPEPVSGENTAVVNDKFYVLTVDFSGADSPASFLSYDPAVNRWTSLPLPPGAASPQLVPAQLVPAGDRLLAISYSDEPAKAIDSVFDPASATWQPLPDDPLGPSSGREAVWLGGELLLTANDLAPNSGSEAPPMAGLATLDTTLTTWTLLPDSEILGGNPMAVGGRVVFPSTDSADGGEVNNWGREIPYGGIFNPSDSSWTPLPDPPAGIGLREVAINVGDRILVDGHLLDPATGDWTVIPDPPWPPRYSTRVLANSDTLFVWGGSSRDQNLADGYLLQF